MSVKFKEIIDYFIFPDAKADTEGCIYKFVQNFCYFKVAVGYFLLLGYLLISVCDRLNTVFYV